MTSSVGILILISIGVLTTLGTLAGFIKCIAEARRPEVNKSTTFSLALAFLYIFLLTVFLLVSSNFDNTQGVDIALTVIGFPIVIAGCVLAIIGLTQLNCQQDTEQAGKLRGITGIGLNSFLLVILCLVSFYTAHERLLETHIVNNGYVNPSTTHPETTIAHKNTTTENPNENYLYAEEFGYKLKIPNDSWAELAAENFNADAKTGLYNSENRAQVFVIPIELPTPNTTVEELSTAARENLAKIGKDSKFSEATPEAVSNIDGLRFNVQVKSGQLTIAYSTWIGIRDGFSYQLFTSMVDGTTEEAEQTGKQVASGFELLELSTNRFTSTEAIPEKVSFPNIGISAHFDPTKWSQWDNVQDDAPEALYGITHNNEAFLIIVPLHHPALTPSIEDLKTSYMEHVFGQDSGYKIASQDKKLESPYQGCEALEVEFSYSMGKYDNFVQSRIYKSKDISYMVATYLSTSQLTDEVQKTLTAALDSVILTPPENLEAYVENISENEREFHGSALNEIGLIAYNRYDYITAKKYFETAFKVQPGDSVLLGNILQTQNELQLYSQAIETYLNNKDRFQDDQRLLALYANSLYQIGKAQEATDVFEALFANDYNDEDDLLEYLNALIDLDQRLIAIAKTKVFIERTESWQATRWLASMQSDEGEYESAEATLRELKKSRPFDSQIDFDLINLFYNANANTKALATYDALEKSTKSQSRFLALKGKIHYAKKEYEIAKQNLEKALESNPNDSDTKEWLEYAANAIGKSDSEVLKKEIQPVKIPDSMLTILGIENTESESESRQKSHIISSIVAIEFSPEKTNKSTTYKRIRIQDEAALETYKTLSFNYDPFAEEVFINQLDVLDENNKLIASGSLDDYYVMDGSDKSMATEDKTLHAPVPGLRKGSTLVYTTTTQSLNSPDKISFTRHFFANRLPSDVTATAIKSASEHYQFQASESLETQVDGDFTVWIQRDTQPYTWEPYQKDIDSFIPKLEISAPDSQWSMLAQEYLERIQSKFDLEERSKEIAQQITENLESDSDKIFAIYRYIQKNFTYKAIEFGQRARIPNNADKTIQNNYGDCKDLSLLAHQLLKSVGVQSQLSLIHSSRKLNAGLPSMDQFDHMILYLPTLDEGRFLDCTSRSASPQFKAPLNLAGQTALVLDNEHSRLINIPKPSENENRIQSHKKLKISGNNILVNETLMLDGSYAAYFREYLMDTQPENMLKKMQRMMADIESDVQLDRIVPDKLNNPLESFVLNLQYQIRNRAVPNSKGEIELKIPSIWEKDYLDVQYIADRKNPFELTTPLSFESNISIEMDGFSTALKKADWNQKSKSVFHNATSTLKKDEANNTLEIAHTIDLLPGEHDASEFENFVISSKNALTPLVRPIILAPNNKGQ